MTYRDHLKHLTVAASLFIAPAMAGATTYTYNLNGNLTDSTGGGPALVGNGGTIGATGYTFGADQGLTLSNIGGAAFNTFSIDILFYFTSDTTARGNGYRRILDFFGSNTDNGLYSHNHDVDFYPVASTPGAVLTNNVSADVLLTKNAAGLITVSVNGGNAFSFDDTASNYANFGPSSTLKFFIDDNIVPGESSSGFVDKITITTNAAAAAVPEPSTWAMMMQGIGGIGFAMRRRARTALKPA